MAEVSHYRAVRPHIAMIQVLRENRLEGVIYR
jgi:hypothetical protein